jgi:hypothetical protein
MLKIRASLSLLFLLIGLASFGQFEGEISILTCTPGQEIYSAFGHTAIRARGTFEGERVDWVYNYGTFEFDESFVWKFTMGKLNYMLSRQEFPYFQYEYIRSLRGIEEQTLNFNEFEKNKLLALLEENYKPENRYYLYDFFYDNCSTRVRDILKEVSDKELSYGETSNQGKSFRDLIHEYLGNFCWTEWGIDIALGLPCDKIAEGEEDMFLPDHLFDRLAAARLGDGPLVLRTEEILPLEEIETSKSWGPKQVTWLFFAVYLVVFFWSILKKRSTRAVDNGVLILFGFIGLFVCFLWFLTDHVATINNLNILWASPLAFVIAFANKSLIWARWILLVIGLSALLALLGSMILPQELHPAILPLALVAFLLSTKHLIIIPRWGKNN